MAIDRISNKEWKSRHDDSKAIYNFLFRLGPFAKLSDDQYGFTSSLRADFNKFGSLTDKQTDALRTEMMRRGYLRDTVDRGKFRSGQGDLFGEEYR